MALTKAMDFGNGVTTSAAYIEISTISLDFINKTASFNIKTFLNKDVANQGLLTIIPDKNFNIGQTIQYPIPGQTVSSTTSSTDVFTTYFATGDPRTNAETYLKTLADYKDCVAA